jgi:hypothetical protein
MSIRRDTDLSWLEPGEAQQSGRRSVFLIPPSAIGGWLRKYYGAPVGEFPNIDAQVRAAIRALLVNCRGRAGFTAFAA